MADVTFQCCRTYSANHTADPPLTGPLTDVRAGFGRSAKWNPKFQADRRASCIETAVALYSMHLNQLANGSRQVSRSLIRVIHRTHRSRFRLPPRRHHRIRRSGCRRCLLFMLRWDATELTLSVHVQATQRNVSKVIRIAYGRVLPLVSRLYAIRI